MIETFIDNFIADFAWGPFLTIIGIDLVLSGDNALIIGMAASRLPPNQRRQAIVLGIVAATLLRILFSIIVLQLLEIIGLLFAGGLLLAWVAYKLYREVRIGAEAQAHSTKPPPASLGSAVILIVVSDVTMSLDNVLAVAGAAQGSTEMLVFGLALSIVLMGVAATLIASLMARYQWIGYAGVVIIAYVALDMMYRGGVQLMDAVGT
ncbi:MAG: YjbE family putative metal transport protein [Pseudomonadota bacterium]